MLLIKEETKNEIDSSKNTKNSRLGLDSDDYTSTSISFSQTSK